MALQVVAKWAIAFLSAGGGGALVAFGLFKWFGQRWIEQHFKTQLERLKHEQAQEIEALRHRTSTLFSRISKIHEKEFEVLPKSWFLMHDAHGKASHVSTQSRYRPNFAGMPKEMFEEFLQGSRLSQYQKGQLRGSDDRLQCYTKMMFWIELNDAKVACEAFHNYLVENRIFMTGELAELFNRVDHELEMALRKISAWKRFGSYEEFESGAEMIASLGETIKAIEKAVQHRFKYAEA